MSCRVIFALVFLLLFSLPAQAHPESFHIIVDVSVTILIQLILFGVFSAIFRKRRCNESLWLGLYGATLVFSILATTEVGHLYPMWIAPTVLYVLMIGSCIKNPADTENHTNMPRGEGKD